MVRCGFSLSTLFGQARLLIGADRIIRVNAPTCEKKIRLDDWSRAVAELPNAAKAALDEFGENAASVFLTELAAPYRPIVRRVLSIEVIGLLSVAPAFQGQN